MRVLRKILYPITPVYYAIIWMRNWCYDQGWMASKRYDFPVICVGNLSVGGTGKTPMIEYLITLFKTTYSVATLSRGYKRLTKGFYIANESSTVATVGDEPFQFYNKFKGQITVAVDADRQHGIAQLKAKINPDIILLDDAFQHRKVTAGFNILLTTFDKLYIDDILLPTGDLRESISGAKRADVIVVTKCPSHLNQTNKDSIKLRLKLEPSQHVFFSHVSYADTVFSQTHKMDFSELQSKVFTLVTGIAKPKPLVEFLEQQDMKFEHLSFSDHHEFSIKELELLNTKSFIVTTEKDYMRLQGKIVRPLYYLPIKVVVDESELFEELIKNFISDF
ncbi:MAG: tetraacyldisaccharide 4'-kinase [Flavobacteriaceae bacterium]|nr:tetraacyldisaccharide 4'-kinase [Flavobacteriaceae bacterium]